VRRVRSTGGSRGVALLGGAIGCEVVGTLSLPASEGFTQPWAAAGVVVGYGLAVLLFSRSLRHGLPLGIAYGTITACGLAAATALSTVVLGEPVDLLRAGGLALIVGGALLLQRRGPGREVRP
jgi:small multidrug resistance pump